jgi:hypothetical protein
VQSKNFCEGSWGRLWQLERAIPVVKLLLFFYHHVYRKHASVDRTLQKVNITKEIWGTTPVKKERFWSLKPVTCSYKFSFIYTVRLGYQNFIFRKLANHQCLFWMDTKYLLFKKLCWLTEMLQSTTEQIFKQK